MGVKNIDIFDEDGVNEHNLPNQFYRVKDIKQFKVAALMDIIKDFSEATPWGYVRNYSKEKLQKVVIVATDSMSSRKMVWEQFKKQPQTRFYIEARMGGELGRLYFIKKNPRNYKFYESTLYSDDKVKPLPCTEKSIIYNVLMIASLVGRGLKSYVNDEKFPRELVFNMKNIYPYSFMIKE